MTRKEIEQFLNGTKVYVNGKSEEIQKKLFLLGYKWDLQIVTYVFLTEEINYSDSPFLLIYDKKIGCVDDMSAFMNSEYREITAEQILDIDASLFYRPFQSADECWREMLKHKPFGWVKNKRIESYTIILSVNDDRDYGKALSEYTFADGAPFGIKEE